MAKPSHYYSAQQTSTFKKREIVIRLRGVEIRLTTGSGVFSKKRIDKGSKLLVDKAIVKKGWNVLDLGCGYGTIGIGIAKAEPETEVTLVDVNKRAVGLAKDNINENNAANAKAYTSDGYAKVKEEFDTILLNPPQMAGKKVCFMLIEQGKKHLVKGGMMQVVARHNIGGKGFRDKMLEVYDNVSEIAKGGGYRVYVSEKE